MEVVFERESLYNDVWQFPMTQLAKRYGLSDNGLRKVCKALAIPLPERGHWAKVSAGQTIKSKFLPPFDGPTQFISRPDPASKSTERNSIEQIWLKERIAFEREAEHQIVVEMSLRRPHPLVRDCRRVVDQARKNLESARKKAEKAKRSQSKKHREPDFSIFDSHSWSHYESHGYLEIPDSVLPLRVSLESADRALCIWDTLLKAAESRGFECQLTKARLTLKLDAIEVDLRMSEELKQVIGSTSGMSEFEILIKKNVRRQGTGNLRVFVCYPGGETRFSDEQKRPIDIQLNAIF
ncbi:hypothetical protein ACFQUU_02540 [Herbaspirillum sp. GCM10030257]|uniref:hypothetical protein n=1 Tax=Herbaspirillum sp. GCM10030257 TaxID=3273393 RepID=UPI0036178868